MDPMGLFRQIAPDGVVSKQAGNEAVRTNGHDQSTGNEHASNGLHNGNSIDHTKDGAACPFLAASNGKHYNPMQQALPVSPPPGTPPRPLRSSRRSRLTPEGTGKSSNGTKHAASSSADEAEKTKGRKRLKMELATEVSAVQLGDAEMDTYAVKESDGIVEHSHDCDDEFHAA